MIRTASHKFSPMLTRGLRAETAATGDPRALRPSKSITAPSELPPRPGRRLSTVIEPTDCTAKQGRLKVKNPGDGWPFAIAGVRNHARAAGDDKPIDPKTASIRIDHGDMTPEQSRRYEAAQNKPVLPHYEASGKEGMKLRGRPGGADEADLRPEHR